MTPIPPAAWMARSPTHGTPDYKIATTTIVTVAKRAPRTGTYDGVSRDRLPR
jgi:hypothetical protein